MWKLNWGLKAEHKNASVYGMQEKEKLQLKAEKRDAFGKRLTPFREKGYLPAVFYGPKDSSQSFFISLADFKKVWREAGESGIVELDFGPTEKGGASEKKQVLIYDVDIDPLHEEPRHVDFYVVDMAKKTTISVPLSFEGESPAVKTLGGVLVKVFHELEVEALPADLPSELKVDISVLKTFEDKIAVSDLEVPQGVEILAEPDETIALVEEPREEEIKEEAPSIEDIEVLSEKPSSDEDSEDKKEEEKQEKE